MEPKRNNWERDDLQRAQYQGGGNNKQRKMITVSSVSGIIVSVPRFSEGDGGRNGGTGEDRLSSVHVGLRSEMMSTFAGNNL